jgi:TerC family integral membrane protein
MLRPGGHGDAGKGEGLLMRFLRRRLRITGFAGNRFFVRQDGRLCGTPLLLALAMVEVSDVVFAIDSIPAIFAVTQDPFLVFTANVFAILGLRSLFFVLAGMVDRFRYLKYGLAIVLTFVGVPSSCCCSTWSRATTRPRGDRGTGAPAPARAPCRTASRSWCPSP